jgi:uncharacterized membrane protein
MLKVPDQGEAERPVGELVQQLIEDGKAYARAEINVVKTTATSKAKALAIPAALIGAAIFIAMAALNALAFGVVLALAKFLGPLLAGVAGLLIFGGIAGGLAWYAVERARREL